MRGLIGFETDLVNQTRGLGVMSHLFHEYGPDRGEIAARKNGSLVSMETGGDGLRAEHDPGTRPADGGAGRRDLRRHDRRRKRPRKRHPGQSLQGQEADQHALRATAKASSSIRRSRCRSNAPSSTSARTNTWKRRPRTCACARIQGFFDIPVDHLYAAPVMYEYLKTKKHARPGGGQPGRGRPEDGVCLFAGAGGRAGHRRQTPQERQRGRVHGGHRRDPRQRCAAGG
jgi:hypothetical protein